jgi:hypothetical protein
VQLLDKQYVYREAHPGAIFESTDGDYYRCDLLDEKNHLVYATELANDTLMRTFPLEEIDVKFLDELGRRSLTRGAQLVWGRAKVTHWYTGYGEYQLIPRRRCRKCGISFASTVERCSECGQRPRPFMDQSDPEYFEFPHPYRVVLETIACRLELPATMEPALKTIALCPISHAGNKVHEFLVAGTPFQNSQELARLSGLGNDASAAAFDYYKQWQPKAEAWQKDHNHSTSFPGVYGQCLCYALREKLPEAPALEAFQKLTGYPATTDKRHICRKCYEGVLLPAAHTLEHVVVRRYPMVALGDSQDISSITYAIHPYTGMTTVVWYDQYEGGIGAAEKIFTQFEGLVQNTHDLLACDCQLDTGCVQCVQLPACDRDNHSLSKVGAAGLTNLLLGMDPFIPEQSFHKRAKKAHDEEDQAEQARHRERAAHDVPRPDTQEQPSGVDPFALMRVQSYVHDVVLAKSIEIRGEEITGELPPISIAVLQQAYQQIKAQERPTEWRCDPSWDAWHTLHILDSASLRMARAARNTIAMVIHPDHYDGDKAEATRMMQIVNAAWEKIKDARS